MTICTTEPVSKMKKAGKEASEYLGVDIVWRRVKAPKRVPTTKRNGKVRIDFNWLSDYQYLHFTPSLKRKWKLDKGINGSSKWVNGKHCFYFSALPGKRARGYKLQEATRLILHEHLHSKASNSTVHRWDYDKKAIHELAVKHRI